MRNTRLLGIEIGDLGVTAARWSDSTAELLPLGADTMELSGFAQLTGKGEVVFGRPAFEQFLTSEFAVDNQYWHRLATAGKDPSMRNRHKSRPSDTELAQTHLTAVIEKCRKLGGRFDEVVLAVPGHFKRSYLGWLIQVSAAVGIRVKHILDSSLASLISASAVPVAKSFLVMDIHWNTAEAVLIESTDSGLERVVVMEKLRALGLRQILDRLVAGLAQRFIDEFRFDPSARPEYAQELYNRLSAYLSDPKVSSACKLRTHKGTLSVDRGALAEMVGNELKAFSDLADQTMNMADDPRDCAVFLTSRFRYVPGMMEIMNKDYGVDSRMMETGQAATGALAFRDALSDDPAIDQPLFHSKVGFISSQERRSESASIPQGKVYHSGRDGILGPTHPTHLLFQGRLLELPEFGEADFAIGKGKSITSGLAVAEPVEGLAVCHALLRRKKDGGIELTGAEGNQTWINGESFNSNGAITLQVGDVITLGAPILQVMIVGMAKGDA